MLERLDLLTPLSRAYGSADRAQAALDRALRRAGLDQLPVAAAELTDFLCAQVHAVVAEDLGSMIAGAMLNHLRNQLGVAHDGTPAASTARRRAIARVAASDRDLPDSKRGGEGAGET